MAFTVSFFVSLPFPRILIPSPHLFHDSCVSQSFGVDRRSVFELLKRTNINGLDIFRKMVDKAAFRDTPLQRHLAAFKTRTDGAAGSCLLALVALAGSFALAGTDASADALRFLSGTGNRRQII